ncbi:hypothetical protein [Sphingomonas sp. UYP23]
MAFFTDRYGYQYQVANVTRIARLNEARDPTKTAQLRYHQVMMSDGESIEVDEFTVDEITKAPIHIIPAIPGTFILGGIDDNDNDPSSVWQVPVIAWSFGQDNEVKPWTADGPDDGLSQPGPLLLPNGLVIEQGNRSYRSIEEWFEVEKKHQAELAARKAAPPSIADDGE